MKCPLLTFVALATAGGTLFYIVEATSFYDSKKHGESDANMQVVVVLLLFYILFACICMYLLEYSHSENLSMHWYLVYFAENIYVIF